MIEFLFLASVVLLIWHFIITPYLVDSIRQDLFEIRDKVFDYHRDSESYDDFRNLLNVFIRYADKVTWQETLISSILLRRQVRSDVGAFKALINSIKQDQNLSPYVEDVLIQISKLTILRSPTLICLTIALIGLLKIIDLCLKNIRLFAKMTSFWRDSIERSYHNHSVADSSKT